MTIEQFFEKYFNTFGISKEMNKRDREILPMFHEDNIKYFEKCIEKYKENIKYHEFSIIKNEKFTRECQKCIELLNNK